MPQAQIVPTKARWLQDAFMETRKWPFWKDGDAFYTICPSCGDDFRFSEKDGYTFRNVEGALTVDPDILCVNPSCDGAIHVYYRDVVLLKVAKAKGAPTWSDGTKISAAVPASDDKRTIVDRVREKIGAGRPR